MSYLSEIWDELTTPDNYVKNWYGYASNQLAHYTLGFTSACILSQAHFAAFGEFAEKWALWFVIGFSYAVFELSHQGWRGKDTVEDWLFFAGYGASTPIFLFSEISPGSPDLYVNSQLSMPVVLVVYGHLFGGTMSRVISARGKDD